MVIAKWRQTGFSQGTGARLGPAALGLCGALAGGCGVDSNGLGTGGIDAGNMDAMQSEDGGPTCPTGVVIAATDANWGSTQVALATLDGSLLSAAFISSASARTDGLSFALSGDIALPSAAPTSGRVVLIDRYGTNVLTWIDPATAHVEAQLPVGTGFDSNPQDYLEIGSGTALVSRWGANAGPAKEAFDSGSDVIVVDISGTSPTITASIPMPGGDFLPRPERMTRVGAKVAVVLERLQSDFVTVGDAQIALLDPKTLAVETLDLAGVADCAHLVPRPGGGFGITCTGPLDVNGKSIDLARSALVLLSQDANGTLSEEKRFSAGSLGLLDPLQHDFTFASRDVALVTTQTQLGGSTNNQLLALHVQDGTLQVLAQARAGSGLAYGTAACTPGCSSVCLLPDGDLGRVRRFDLQADAAAELPAVELSPGVGLFPREISHFGVGQ